MGEVERTVKKFRDFARQRGARFIVLTEGGGLFLFDTKPNGEGFLDCAQIDSKSAVELVRRAVEEFGMHYLTGEELGERTPRP